MEESPSCHSLGLIGCYLKRDVIIYNELTTLGGGETRQGPEVRELKWKLLQVWWLGRRSRH